MTWPNILPYPSINYSLESGNNTIRTDMESGSPRVRLRSVSTPDTAQLEFILNADQMSAFRAYWETDWAYGSIWVSLPVLDGRSSAPVYKECRPTTANYQAKSAGRKAWRVTLGVEIRRGTYYFYDAINALQLPSLELNFAGTKSLSPVIRSLSQPAPTVTFTRSSTATYFDANGVLQTAAINEPRFDHDPITNECKGLLIEEARTNLLLNSATLVTQSITTTATARTLSFYGAGTVVLSGTHSATVVGTGAFPTRTTYTYTPTSGTLTLTVTGTVQYANDEAGAFATSYIPTTTTQVTRAAEVCQMAGNDFSAWYRQDEGSIVADFIVSDGNSTGSDGKAIVMLCDNTASNLIAFQRQNNNQAIASSIVGGVSQVSSSGLVIVPNSYSKAGIAYKANDFISSLNGVAGYNDTTCAIPTVDRLYVGVSYNGANRWINGHISKITYYPRRISNAGLQGLTA